MEVFDSNKKKHVLLGDIAKELGIHKNSVARVIRSGSLISADALFMVIGTDNKPALAVSPANKNKFIKEYRETKRKRLT